MRNPVEHDPGYHNGALAASRSRILSGNTYRKASIVCVVPTRGLIPTRVVQSWMNLIAPMNHPFLRMFIEGHEVGQAYSLAVEAILNDPNIAQWEYLLTLEEDNMPPPDGVLKLVESINCGFDVVGGLYWTKGPGGQPMIYGDPHDGSDFTPQAPVPGVVQPCRGLGMGFTLFRIKMFKDKRFPRPFFRTLQEFDPAKGTQSFTQDLYFFDQAMKLGYKVACDNRVLVGHYDHENAMVW